MKPIIVASTLALSAMFAAGAAMAAPPAKTTTPAHSTAAPAKPKEHTASGVVKAYDSATHMLVLASGQKFTVDSTGAPDGLKSGDKVDVKWIAKGKSKEAEQVTIKN